jgi:hypothetical protein
MALDMQKMKDTIADMSERNMEMERLIREMARKQRISTTDGEDHPSYI